MVVEETRGQRQHRPQVGGEQTGHYPDLVVLVVVGEKGEEREQLRRLRDRLRKPAILDPSNNLRQLDRLSRDTKPPGE